MAEIEVKSSQVVKTGTNKNGPWELIRVTSVDGTEYTTFDKKAKHQGAGAVIDIGEVVIKQGKLSFKEIVKVVKEGQGLAASSNGKPYQADPTKLASEELRSRMHAAKDLWVAGKLQDGDPEVKLLRSWIMGKLMVKPQPDDKDWEDLSKAASETTKAAEMPPQPSETAPKDKAEVSDLRKLEIKNLGDLFTACQKHFKMSKSDALKELGGITQEQIADPKDSWLQIIVGKE